MTINLNEQKLLNKIIETIKTYFELENEKEAFYIYYNNGIWHKMWNDPNREVIDIFIQYDNLYFSFIIYETVVNGDGRTKKKGTEKKCTKKKIIEEEDDEECEEGDEEQEESIIPAEKITIKKIIVQELLNSQQKDETLRQMSYYANQTRNGITWLDEYDVYVNNKRYTEQQKVINELTMNLERLQMEFITFKKDMDEKVMELMCQFQ